MEFGSLTKRQINLTCLKNLSVDSERTKPNPSRNHPPIKYTNPTKTTVNQEPKQKKKIPLGTKTLDPQAQRLNTTVIVASTNKPPQR